MMPRMLRKMAFFGPSYFYDHIICFSKSHEDRPFMGCSFYSKNSFRLITIHNWDNYNIDTTTVEQQTGKYPGNSFTINVQKLCVYSLCTMFTISIHSSSAGGIIIYMYDTLCVHCTMLITLTHTQMTSHTFTEQKQNLTASLLFKLFYNCTIEYRVSEWSRRSNSSSPNQVIMLITLIKK